jgi:hypothetical protein
MRSASKKYADYLSATRVLFANVEKYPEVKTRIAEFSYDDARLTEGKGLRTQFEDLYRLHLETYQARLAAYQRVREARTAARITYGDMVKRLRSHFRYDPEARADLGLNGDRLETRSGFLEQATHFYNAASTHADIQAKILPLGLTPEKIGEAAATLAAYQSEWEEHERLKGECQQIVVDRDLAFKVFRHWVTTFVTTCLSAFRDNPQTLEKLGVFVRNRFNNKSGTGEAPPPDTGTGTGTEPDPGSVTEPAAA